MIHQLPPLKPLASTFPRRDSLPSGRDDGHGKKMNALPLLFCMISADRFLMMVS